ncbi:hypothetical protein [Kordia sp.]|uniref:hypothetical protein n=1 Tax=Kordia sp. TaxID=1965332 RepID=UPI003B5AC81A
MKKKNIKHLSLNKIKISKIETIQNIKGGSQPACLTPIILQGVSDAICSAVYGTCGCPSGGCDHTRDCPSWNVAC